MALQRAIDGQNMESIWSEWQGACQRADQLGRDEHRKLLRLCSSYVVGRGETTLADLWNRRLPQIARVASLTGDVDLICDWFRLLLAVGQPDDVVNIWEDMVHIRLAAGSNGPSTDGASDMHLAEGATDEKFIRIDVSSSGDRVDIHDMVCLVAFSCFQSTRVSHYVELFDKLEFGSPFRLFFNMPRAKGLFDSLTLPRCQTPSAARILDWNTTQTKLWSIELARGLSSGSGGPQRIARLLGSLFQMRQVEEAYAIFQAAMRASSQSPPWLSVETQSDSTSSPQLQRAQWTESCWSVCLSNFIASDRSDLATDVWSKFRERQLRPSARIWNALLDGYGRAKNYEAAQQTWSAAVNQAGADPSTTKLPDEQMYTTMINIHFLAKKIEAGMALLSEMMAKDTKQGGKLHVQAETFNAVVHGLFLNGRHARAESLLDEMMTKGPAPNIGTINTFLRAYARVGDLTYLASTLRLADKLKLTPDIVTFTTILDALLRKGGESATEAVVKTLRMMTSMGVQPNVVTYTAMIKACLVGAEAALLDVASKSMLGDSLHKDRRHKSSNQVRVEAALELLDRMVESKVAPSEITYTALIGGCLQNPDAVAHAFETKTVPRPYWAAPKPLQRLKETAQTVQRWSDTTPDVSLALLLLEHMKNRGLSPTTTTFHYLIEGLCSPRTDQAAFIRSMDLIDDMLLRSGPSSAPQRQLGPFASIVLKGKNIFPLSMHAPSHTTWIIIFSSLLDRLEYGPRDRTAAIACARALNTATRLVREMCSLSGAEGGMSLSRLVERAASLTSKLPR